LLSAVALSEQALDTAGARRDLRIDRFAHVLE
jgi:hypothetical protein